MAIVAAGFFAYTKINAPAVNTAKAEPGPWVEVVSASVTETVNGRTSVLKTGDELEVGATITTDAKGKANIYFPSGSVARLDGSSSLVLQEAKASSTSWSVRLMLLGGRVWSKIGSVANADTSWEVRTSNAVAVVRGTAFSMEFKNGVSKVLGAEHTVKVAPLDPKTGEEIASSSVDLAETKFVEIRDDKLEAIKEHKVKLQTQDETKTIQNDIWFKDNKKHDGEFQDKIDKVETKLQTSGDENADTNTELKKEILNVSGEQELNNEPTSSETKPAANTGAGGGTSIVAAKPSELVLSSDSDLNQLKDGSKASLKAFLKMSDGTKKDVTSRSKWSVSGGVGVVGSDGILNAAIDPNLGDVQFADGEVAADWEENGVKFHGKSQVKVFPDIPPVNDNIGGQ